MELNQSMLTENHTWTINSRHHDHSLVAQRSLVPHNSVSEHDSTFVAPSVEYRPPLANSNLAYDQQFLETRRLDIIRSMYQQSTLNPNAQAIFLDHHLQDSSTDRTYNLVNYCFLSGALSNTFHNTFSQLMIWLIS